MPTIDFFFFYAEGRKDAFDTLSYLKRKVNQLMKEDSKKPSDSQHLIESVACKFMKKTSKALNVINWLSFFLF